MRRVTLLTVPVLALALTACGGSGPRPGTAIAVGDLSVTTKHVDDVATRYCQALTKVGTQATSQTVRNQVVGALAARLVAERFAEVRGITPGASYEAEQGKLRSQLSKFDDRTQDAIVEVEGAQSYVSAVVGQVGEPAFTQWLHDQHVVVNPVYGMKVEGDRFTRVDPSLSVAASDLAKESARSAADPSAQPAAGTHGCA